MHDLVAETRSDDGDVVDAVTDTREQVRHFQPTLAVLAKLAIAAEQLGVRFDELILRFAERCGTLLTVESIEQRFGIEGFNVTRTTGHEQENHRFRQPVCPRWPSRQRIPRWVCRRGLLGMPQARQRQRSHPATGLLEPQSSIQPGRCSMMHRCSEFWFMVLVHRSAQSTYKNALRLNNARANSRSGWVSRNRSANSTSIRVGLRPVASWNPTWTRS